MNKCPFTSFREPTIDHVKNITEIQLAKQVGFIGAERTQKQLCYQSPPQHGWCSQRLKNCTADSSVSLSLIQAAWLFCLFQSDGLAWEQLLVVLTSYVKLEEMSLAYLVTFRDFLNFLSGFFTSWVSMSPHLEHSPVSRNFPPRWHTLILERMATQ